MTSFSIFRQHLKKFKKSLSEVLNTFENMESGAFAPIRAATFTKFGKRLHEFQLPKQLRLHVTSKLIFFIMQIGKIADFFPKNHLKNVHYANIRNCLWLGVVIELISSNRKVIATWADSYITDIFFSCKRVINEWTHTRCNCESSHTHQSHADRK